MSRLLATALIVFAACTSSSTEPDDVVDPDLPPPITTDPADDPSPTSKAPWVNQPVPFVAYYHDVTVAFRIDQASAIDAVVGLADGKVDALSDLGPSLKLDAQGRLTAVDGAGYRADQSVSYVGAPVDVLLRIDLERHRYSVEANGVMLATAYTFGSAQATLARIDTLASLVETTDATLALHDVTVGPEWCSVAGQSWVQLYHPAQTGAYRVKFRAQVPESVGEATIGLTGRDAAAVDDLTGALRFDAGAPIQARDGATFRADSAMPYEPDRFYDVELAVDIGAQRYSVTIDGAPLATSYALAGGATPLSQLGLHAANGYVRVCDLMVWNY